MSIRIVCALLVIGSLATGTATWDGGGTGDWCTCTNWQGDSCPSPSDVVHYHTAGDFTFGCSSSPTVTVKGLHLDGQQGAGRITLTHTGTATLNVTG